jgi:hypothetical protein
VIRRVYYALKFDYDYLHESCSDHQFAKKKKVP